ncbi:MAG: Aerotaxis receptor [Pseudomonadota bacterium]|jgi:PAS domain S-box-containing protein
MKLKITPNDREVVMRDDDFIVSKTDPKGRITYGNKIFIEFSGYEERDLIGKQHNVVRHPDMPRAVFHMLWGNIQTRQEIFAYVKNLCQDGSYYWVLANVTPSVDPQGNVLGYYSVRRKPNRKAVAYVTDLYRKMLEIERQAGTKDAISASTAYLQSILNEKGVSYEQFALGLQAL